MQRWEHARFIWEGEDPRAARRVGFSHSDPWVDIGTEDFWATMKRLGDGGFELVSSWRMPGSSDRPFTESWILYFKRPMAET